MSKNLKTAAFVALVSIAACETVVPLVTFDGVNATTFAFEELEDSVMGSESYGNWTLGTGAGLLSGIVTIVPRPAVSIVHASPGFIKAAASGVFSDASAAAAGSLVLVVRSTTPYAGFRASFASGTAHPSYACEGGGSIPKSRGCFKSSNFTVPTPAVAGGFSSVSIPFAQFSDRWTPATGEHSKTCAQDASTCVTGDTLKGIQRIEVWAEGATGNVHLELKSISAHVSDSQQKVV
jgi:hypothetical protein